MKQLIAFAFIFVVLLSTAAVTVASAPVPSSMPANITITAPVKTVTLYSNGYSFVTRSGTVSIAGGAHTLHLINFTTNAVSSSITPSLSSGKVSEVYYYTTNWNESKNVTKYFELNRLLNDSIGSNISFTVGNSTAGGQLVWLGDGQIGVASGSGVAIYYLSDITRLALPTTHYSELVQENTSKWEAGLAVGVKEGIGNAVFSLSYLTRGADWSPSYKYYLSSEGKNGSGVLQGWATVNNNAGEDWENVSLRLVVGNPYIYDYSPFRYPYTYSYAKDESSNQYSGYAGSAVPSVAPDFTSSQVSAYYVYSLATPATVRNGEEKRLPLLENRVNYTREYVWKTMDSHPYKVFILNNTGNESWAAGVASVYLNGEFLGENALEYTPKNAEARLIVSDLPDIKAERVVLNQSSNVVGNTRTYYYKVKLTMTNAMNENVTVMVNEQMESGDEVRLVSSTIPAQVKPGNVLEWNATIQKGAQWETIVEYTVTDYYINRY